MRAAIFDLDDTLYEREQFVLSGFAAWPTSSSGASACRHRGFSPR
jgi:FMN phosphatase YigB (HAD superfamily)